jgi:hypothetical protein
MMLPGTVLLSFNIGLIFAVAIVYHFLEGAGRHSAVSIQSTVDFPFQERLKLEMNIGIAERNFMTKFSNIDEITVG